MYRKFSVHYVWRRLFHFCIRHRNRTSILLVSFCIFIYLRLYLKASTADTYITFHISDTFNDIKGLWTRQNMECISWHPNYDCNTNTMSSSLVTKSCKDNIIGNVSGYCEYRNISSKTIHKVMLSSCGINNNNFSCNMGYEFHNFNVLSSQVLVSSPIPPIRTSLERKRGIVLAINQDVLINVFVIIRLLREFGCSLPIELWYKKGFLNTKDELIIKLTSEYGALLRKVNDNEKHINNSRIKIYGLFYSNFDEVLLLDTNIVPVKDPSYLFDSTAFHIHGAMFWPDYWHPSSSINHLNQSSKLWELLDLPFTFMFEQENGQLLIDRRRFIDCLKLLMFYASNIKIFQQFHLEKNEKDLFRLTWLKLRKQFFMIQRPPSAVGLSSGGKFCGLSSVHYDPFDQVLFFHRNTIAFHKEAGDWPWWTHLQEYIGIYDPSIYSINLIDKKYHSFGHYDCIGKFKYHKDFIVTPIENTPFSKLEHMALLLVKEAKKIRNN